MGEALDSVHNTKICTGHNLFLVSCSVDVEEEKGAGGKIRQVWLSWVKDCFNGLSGKPRCLPVPALSRIPGPVACVKKTALHSAPGGLD